VYFVIRYFWGKAIRDFFLLQRTFPSALRSSAHLTLHSSVVTICTARFNIQKLHSLSTPFVHAFCTELRKNSIISLCITNWPVFKAQMKFIYCAVRTKSLIQVIFGFNARVMARTVSRRPFIEKTRVRSQDLPRTIRGRQSGTRTCVRVLRLSHISSIPPLHHNLLNPHVAVSRRTSEHSQKQCSFRTLKQQWVESCFHTLCLKSLILWSYFWSETLSFLSTNVLFLFNLLAPEFYI
jgi:hypothetical protein